MWRTYTISGGDGNLKEVKISYYTKEDCHDGIEVTHPTEFGFQLSPPVPYNLKRHSEQ